MDFHLEHELRLHTEPEFKNLYKWAINEFDTEGKQIGLDQIPWQWSLWFTATSCVLSDSVEITQPLRFKFKVTTQDGTVAEQESGGREDTIDRRQSIRIELRPGRARDDDDTFRRTAFSMLGTNRVIKSFQLNVSQLTDPSEQERCTAWGSVSYTSEGADFRDETSDDCIVFYLAVKPETFARYVEKISHGSVDEIILRVGKVDGFYSEWSPSISTDKVKVLTRGKEHKVTVPPDSQLEPPRLGVVGDAALYINRRLEFGKPKTEVIEEEGEDERERPATVTQAPSAIAPQLLPVLRSLRRAAWFIVWLLALIFIAQIR